MREMSMVALAMVMALGACAEETNEEPTTAATGPTAESPTAGDETAVEASEAEEPTAAAPDFILPSYSEEQLAGLPNAPWSTAVGTDAAPADLISAWQTADNGSWCAPLVPAGASMDGARASTLDGGWALEVDQRGAPGVRENGESCRRCGRSAFGIAGTSMPVDSLNDMETDAAPSPTYADGSTTAIQSEDGVASATITVGGQGCVYQVWSFLGEDHLNELLEGLRVVAVEPRDDGTAVATSH